MNQLTHMNYDRNASSQSKTTVRHRTVKPGQTITEYTHK
jgi:hypothetical protein